MKGSENGKRVLEYVVVLEAKDADAELVEPLGASLVIKHCSRFGMLPAITLNGELGANAIKVQDVAGDRVLPSELKAG